MQGDQKWIASVCLFLLVAYLLSEGQFLLSSNPNKLKGTFLPCAINDYIIIFQLKSFYYIYSLFLLIPLKFLKIYFFCHSHLLYIFDLLEYLKNRPSVSVAYWHSKTSFSALLSPQYDQKEHKIVGIYGGRLSVFSYLLGLWDINWLWGPFFKNKLFVIKYVHVSGSGMDKVFLLQPC